MAAKSEFEVEVKSTPEKFWEALRNSTDLFPKIIPELIKSIENVEGDGKSVGSISLIKYAEGTPLVTFVKEKVVVVDVENKLMSYIIIDGETLGLYKNLKVTVQITSKGEGSLIKWTLEYDKAFEDVPKPFVIEELLVKTFNGVDAYLQNH